MAQISESYASPGLRLGLLLEDHPQATYRFDLVTGEQIGVPGSYGGNKQFCLCTITFGADRAEVSAWKPVADKGTPDEWNILCTKTLGRALKRAGYPDDLKDLKALVLWRQRDAEIAAIRGGTAQVALPSANAIDALPAADPMQVALDRAAVTDAEAVGADEVDYETGEVLTAALPVEVEAADEEQVALVEELVAGLTTTERKNWTAYCKTMGLPSKPSDMTSEDVASALMWLEEGA
jgi:hypothetical protein